MRKRLALGENIYVANSRGRGRGVFARRALKKGDLIELCPVVLVNKKDRQQTLGTILDEYLFSWGKSKKEAVIALGFGSLYNHSPTPNAMYDKNLQLKLIAFVAIKPIKKDEEITTVYGWETKLAPKWYREPKEGAMEYEPAKN